MRIATGTPVGPGGLAVAHVKWAEDSLVITLGREVTETNVLKVLAHEILHLILEADPLTYDASQALDSYWKDGVEHLYLDHDSFGLPARRRRGPR